MPMQSSMVTISMLIPQAVLSRQSKSKLSRRSEYLSNGLSILSRGFLAISSEQCASSRGLTSPCHNVSKLTERV